MSIPTGKWRKSREYWVLTETGKPSASFNFTETAQAEYLSYVYLTIEPLVSKIFFYELKNGRWAPDPENDFGLLTYEGTKKEAYYILWNINRIQENK